MPWDVACETVGAELLSEPGQMADRCLTVAPPGLARSLFSSGLCPTRMLFCHDRAFVFLDLYCAPSI